MRKQALRYTTTGVIGVVLAIALTGMVNWIARALPLCRLDLVPNVLDLDKTRTSSPISRGDPVVVFMTRRAPV